jgi:hypothetical protein
MMSATRVPAGARATAPIASATAGSHRTYPADAYDTNPIAEAGTSMSKTIA